ncbi:Ail/Lom family outer membrane beta-barrel protein [Ewingella americana]|uniref:Ail/Lom family outer membrane beta-barrel protein n=1 Tax=Ewingella americana TaxID=41202 RepID=UPI00163B2F2D|nr:Ail/Lom family outer membrane beta-barrel protein [Ewingella americana]QMV51001.1 Ail/Lom family outer membrane beta-barrel protein [Ewingella americana]
MKYSILSLVVLASVGVSTVAKADSQTISLGYAQSKVQDFKNMRGVNAKYRYEWDSRVSILGSFTYMSGSKDTYERLGRDVTDNYAAIKYYSLGVGPVYRINKYVSVYGLAGLNYSKIDYSNSWGAYQGAYPGDKYEHQYDGSGSKKVANFMYGAGIQINPLSNISVDVGYEGSRVNDGYNNYSVNGFNVGVGYRF